MWIISDEPAADRKEDTYLPKMWGQLMMLLWARRRTEDPGPTRSWRRQKQKANNQ